MGTAIGTLDIAVFTRQLATMTRAGVPMVQAIDIVMDGTDKPLMKDLVRQIRNDVSGGLQKTSETLLYCSVAAGRTRARLRSCLIVLRFTKRSRHSKRPSKKH